MNYIAHIHIGHHTQTSLLGNFLGDFVKGANFEYLPIEQQAGVQLHRKVDVFTDQHEVVKRLKSQFPKSIKRMAGVALDIYFDHLLLVHWEAFCDTAFEQVVEHFYAELSEDSNDHNHRYSRVRDNLLQHRWLVDYQHQETCLVAMQSIESRLRNRIQFAQQSIEFLAQNHAAIERDFLTFYPELMSYSDSQKM